MSKYHIHIGLEIHCQMNTTRKIFCNCESGFGSEPNRNVCPICLGYPGVLPHLNTQAMDKAYLTAMALGCALTTETAFARKNYFYPDLPKNYQISQFAAPLGRDGSLVFDIDGNKKKIDFLEVHLEEDAGRMVHSSDHALLDFNRTGTPLLEMVTAPHLRSGREAEELLLLMRKIVRYLGVSDGNMDEGSLRCDANVSVSVDSALPPYKVEIKNMNSMRFVRLALEYEINRQSALLDEGKRPAQETRLWNENRDVTVAMRSKEVAMDYRYFPEPDLPVFVASSEFLARARSHLVELPHIRMMRFEHDYQLSAHHARDLTAERETADYFEETVRLGGDAQQVAQWIMGDIRKMLRQRREHIHQCALTPVRLASLLDMLDSGEIHGKIAKQLVEIVFEQAKDPADIVSELGIAAIRGEELRALIMHVMDDNPTARDEFIAGKKQARGYLMGKIMAATNGQASPHEANELLDALMHE